MKKIILAMAFVFTTGSIMNANDNQSLNLETNCFEFADSVATEYENANPNEDFEAIHHHFNLAYDDCMRWSEWKEGEFYLD